MLRGAAAAKASHGITTATNAQGPHSKEAGQAQGKGQTASCGLGRRWLWMGSETKNDVAFRDR